MAEINYNNLYNQMGLLDQKFYDSTFKNTYDPNKSQTMLEGKSGYDQMKAAYEAQQQVPEKSFISSAMSALNPFSELSAAEMPQVPNVSLGTPQINFNTGITGASSAIPNINGVPMINTGALFNNQNFSKFNNQVNNQTPQVNNQTPFNDYYGPNIDTSFGVANEEDEEQEFSLKDSLSGLGRKMGISSLIGMITGNPIIGLIGRGIGALTGGSSFVGPKGSTGYGNDSAMSLFRRSSTGAQFFQGLRDKKAREDAAARGAAKANMADARAITNRINTGKIERGPNENTGGGGGGGGGFNSNNSSGYDGGNFCFDPSTPIQMSNGSTKEIKNIQLGDDTKGGEVTGVFQFKASDEIHDYKGVTVAGSHYVKEDGKFIMVKDSPLAVKIDKIPVVYSLDTSGRRIFIKDIEFADYNGDGVAKNFLNNAGVDLTGFDKEVLRQVENRLI